MSRIRTRVLSPAVCAAIAVLLTACAGGPGPGSSTPDAEPNLFEALPSPSASPPEPTAEPTTEPTPETTPSPTADPEPTTTTPNKSTTAEDTESAQPVSADEQGTAPAGPGPGWQQVSGDEFNAPSLDTGMWNRYDSVGGFGTGYRRPEAVSQSNGTLQITARGDVSGGMGHTFGKLYGRWEFRARTDPGRGFGSAILLWPDSENWPEDGEIDIMEVPGENRDLAHFVLHWGAENNVHGTAVPGDYAQWHTFAVEWLPDRITWYVDGVKQYENTDKAAIPTTPMHLTIQLDQGPKEGWIPARDETTPEEITLEVDWVRIYAPA